MWDVSGVEKDVSIRIRYGVEEISFFFSFFLALRYLKICLRCVLYRIVLYFT